VEDFVVDNNVPREIASDWLDRANMVLILDALDEVPVEHRNQCVSAINNFLRESLVPVIVSCRTDGYEQLQSKLLPDTVLVLRPLTRAAVDNALEAHGDAFPALKAALASVPNLYDALNSPLMIDVARIAYANSSDLDLAAADTVSELKRCLFDGYVLRMINGRRPENNGHLRLMKPTLSWIATNLCRFGQTYFNEWSLVQLSWLPSSQSNKLSLSAMKKVGYIVGGLIGMQIGAILGAFGSLTELPQHEPKPRRI